MKNLLKYFCAALLVQVVAFGCASKKYDTRLVGIQKQISYLTESHSRLSLKLSEIQDSLLVLQNQVESHKSVLSGKAERGKTVRKTVGVDTKKVTQAERDREKQESYEGAKVFDLGAISHGLAGKPGEIFKLEEGDGYIRIEGGTKGSKGSKPRIARIIRDPSSTLNPKEFYKKAFSQYSKRRFDDAIKTFSDFLKLFPEHDLSDNALYWIGESYVAKEQHALALPEFQRVPLEYPNGNKVPDALLMIGICFDKLKNRGNAKESWKRLLSFYPDTLAAKKAKRKLETIDNSDTL